MNITHRKHYPAEIFGYPVENRSKQAEQITIKFRDKNMSALKMDMKI